jgi:putative ABC transport system ATP-binding protein
MTFVTAVGRESIDRWPALTLVIVAFARRAMKLCSALGITLSAVPTKAHERAEPPEAGCALRHLDTPADPMSAEATGWDRRPMQTLLTESHAAPPATTVVSASDVVRRYGTGDTAVDALRGVSVDIARGRLTAVMGPSGSGKSTLMHILAGLDKPTAGEVSVAGVDITGLDDTALTRLRRDHIGFIFQFFNLLPMLTAAENIALPLKLAGQKPDPAWLEELIATVGLGDRLTHRPSELSGGQQQRVAVARALVSRPTVMFADEPTGNLDSTTSGEILGLLRRSVDALGQTTVMVTHDAHAAAIADRVLFLADGHIVRDLGRSSAHEILETLEEVSGR